MVRAAKTHRVFFVEEPIFGAAKAELITSEPVPNVVVCTPHLPEAVRDRAIEVQRELLSGFALERSISQPIAWFYTPMALELLELPCALTVYDCMDELSAFQGAPPELSARETELLRRAHLVFTGGQSLYESKRHQHANVHSFPSSVDAAHFQRARSPLSEPADQAAIARPRLGFFGVIDERMDLGLLDQVARRRPDWQLVMIGPVVKIEPGSLPRLPNLHYLGQKSYAELPDYLAGWDVALMPFAQNESTRFISPTKTLEYLAGGRPVVSTPVPDVVNPYGAKGLVEIARSDGFVAAIECALREGFGPRAAGVDALLASTSWDRTWTRMQALIDGELERGARGFFAGSPSEPRSSAECSTT